MVGTACLIVDVCPVGLSLGEKCCKTPIEGW